MSRFYVPDPRGPVGTPIDSVMQWSHRACRDGTGYAGDDPGLMRGFIVGRIFRLLWAFNGDRLWLVKDGSAR